MDAFSCDVVYVDRICWRRVKKVYKVLLLYSNFPVDLKISADKLHVWHKRCAVWKGPVGHRAIRSNERGVQEDGNEAICGGCSYRSWARIASRSSATTWNLVLQAVCCFAIKPAIEFNMLMYTYTRLYKIHIVYWNIMYCNCIVLGKMTMGEFCTFQKMEGEYWSAPRNRRKKHWKYYSQRTLLSIRGNVCCASVLE